MNLKDLILEILKRVRRFKSREITRSTSILDDGIPYSKKGNKETMLKELNDIVNYVKYL